ncbi:MAG: saccharopine dehydrogenase NADP-binding domain-containing protein [Bacteroidetes bacterium]|nr:saccharopine dehydrogenase NADP-binding domain-containing protein [Bacteroidota bacterium]
MKKILVLGAGMVGKAIAIDLCKSYKVTSADIDQKALDYISEHYPIKTIHADLDNADTLKTIVSDYDFIVSAVPGFMGYKTLECIIGEGKNVVDISFMPEDFMELHKLAVKNGVTAITDCGVAPGMPNLIAGYYNEIMNIEFFEYVVGGLPKVKTYPFYYKAPFSPIDVIEEYTRPARYRENGSIVVKPAMSDTEMMEFDKVGTLQAFLTDGLRSLLDNLPKIPSMKEKTLRHPGHIDLVQALEKAGFFDKTPIAINNTAVRPIDFTSKILINNWKLSPEEEEFTVMRIIMRGMKDKKKVEIVYDLYDEYDKITGLSSMARTTGFTATACLDLVVKGLFNAKGIFPLELVGKEKGCFDFVIQYLSDRNIHYVKKENVIDAQ